MQAARIRTAAAIALTMPRLRGRHRRPRAAAGHARRTYRDASPARRRRGAPTVRIPVAGALPPDVFVIEPDEEPGAPAWLLWTIAASTLAAALAALVVLARDLRGRVVAPSAPPRLANGAGDDRGSALQQGR